MRVFPPCTNAAELLKIQVGKLRLLNDDNSEVDLNSAADINARHATLSAQCQSYTETVYGWSKAWHIVAWLKKGLKSRSVSMQS